MANVKFGACAWVLPEHDMLETLELLQKIGLEGLELNLGVDYQNSEFMSEESCKVYLKKASECGVEISSIALNGFGPYCPLLNDSAEKEKDFIDAVHRIAKNMKLKIIQIPAFGAIGMNTDSDIEITAGFMQKLCDKVADDGIIVSSENTMSAENNLKLCEKVNRENFKVYFDTQNGFAFGGYSPPEMLEILEGKYCEVHAKDGFEGMANRLLGQGNCSFIESIKVLQKQNYQGFIHFENSYMTMANGDESKAIELIKEDLKFIKGLFNMEEENV